MSALEALTELVATKQMREEVSRRKQRRACSLLRDPAEVRAVAALHKECKVRESRAWAVARAVIANPASDLDMLAALREAEPIMADCLAALGACDHSVGICNCDMKRSIESMRAAIAKATGGAS